MRGLVLVCLFVLGVLGAGQVLTSIGGHGSVAGLRKTMIYIDSLDHVNNYVYTKFGLGRSVCFCDVERGLGSGVGRGPWLCCGFAEVQARTGFHACLHYLQE